jgi:hypothetical protein
MSTDRPKPGARKKHKVAFHKEIYFFLPTSHLIGETAMACLLSPIIERLYLVVLTCSLVKGCFVLPPAVSWSSSTANISNHFGGLFLRNIALHRKAKAHFLQDRQQPALLNRRRHNLPNCAQRRCHVAHVVGLCSAAINDDDGEPADTPAASAIGKPSSDNTNCKIEDPKFVQRNKHWVIIVDDEEAIRMAVGNYLYDQGYQVTACADADALLEVCAKPGQDGSLPVVPNVIIR